MTADTPGPPEPGPFDICGELPGKGITVLEASAGTGKTFTIAGLMARMVADGVGVSEILAVTFTRMATGELRDRIRARLVSAEEWLGRFLDGQRELPDADGVVRLLAEGDRDLVAARRDRLARALASFDAATITTTHGFCQLVLGGMGVAGEVAVGARLLEDPRDLVEEVVDDLYLQRVLRHGVPVFARGEAGQIGWAAVQNADAVLVPEPDQSPSGRRRRLAERVRAETNRRLRDANLLTYDDLLIRLRDALGDAERGRAACDRLRDRYRVVLVDEFQDTDPVQWEVVRSAFGSGSTTLVLIGDPKQAIYAFRGADVFAYLGAAREAGRRFTLGTNWRSDRDLLDAYEAVFDPLLLGHPDIPYRPVQARPGHERAGLEGAPVPAALRWRVAHRADGLIETTPTKPLFQKGAAVRWVAEDLAADVVALLSSGARLVDRPPGAPSEPSDRPPGATAELSRPVAPKDVAVLVRTNHQAGVVHEALRSAGVPAVVAGIESVFRTDSARDWLRLLEALEQPAFRSRAAAVALGPFLGLSAAELAEADEGRWEEIHSLLHTWEDVLRHRGVGALARTIASGQGMTARLLARPDGERRLTDLAHIAQLLHAEAANSQLGLPALRAWLARRIREGERDETDADERSRRLDSDAEAVQVLTVHRAKGLEFPVVYCPYLWDGFSPERRGPVVFHDRQDANRRKLEVGGDNGANHRPYQEHLAAGNEEARGESIRHLYVALTRAKNQAVVWWAATQDCQQSALGRLLLARGADGTVAVDGPKKEPEDAVVTAELERLAARAPGCISVERAGGSDGRRWEPDASGAASDLEVARLDRALDFDWRRTSYSGITARSHEELIGSEPEETGTVDEPVAAAGGAWTAGAFEPAGPLTGPPTGPPVGPDGTEVPETQEALEAALRAVPSPLAEVPGGAEVGTFVHSVLEEVDFSAADLEEELGNGIRAVSARGAPDLGETPALAGGLLAAISTPLGPLAGQARLAEVGRADRLDELTFELPLAGGDRPVGEVVTADMAALFAEHVEPTGRLRGYADRLADPLLASNLRGYLTGSIDLVFRLRDGDERYFVVDYKSNWLGPPGEALSAWHYRPSALEAEMQRLHYPLQAVLYMVALHRYLRWRLPGYQPDRHLGGVLYLFLRGMSGPTTPTVDGAPCGVFSWPTPPALVTSLSDLLATGSDRSNRTDRSARSALANPSEDRA